MKTKLFLFAILLYLNSQIMIKIQADKYYLHILY